MISSKKVYIIKTKRYHPFHSVILFYRDVHIICILNVLLLDYSIISFRISIFLTTIALKKIKGSAMLFKSILWNWKVLD